MAYAVPILIFTINTVGMTLCICSIAHATDFRHLNDYSWAFIVTFGGFIGQFLYLVFEYRHKRNDHKRSVQR